MQIEKRVHESDLSRLWDKDDKEKWQIVIVQNHEGELNMRVFFHHMYIDFIGQGR